MHPRQIYSYLVTGCVAASFLFGVGFREVLAAVDGVRIAQGGLPEAIAGVRVMSGRGQLDPLSTYSRALTYLKENYWGELPSDTQLTYTAIHGMLKTMDDPYTRFLDPKSFKAMSEENHGEFVGIGAQLDNRPTKDGYIRIFRPLVNTPAERAGIKPLDVILKVNNTSTQNKEVDAVVQMIRGPANTPVKLTLRRKDAEKPIEVTIIRKPVQYEIVDDAVKAGDIGYISLQQFNELCDEKIDQALTRLEKKGVKGLILDLRSNPGGMLTSAQEIASRFVPAGKPVVHIVERGGRRNSLYALDAKQNHKKLPLVVLVNRMSASASEIVAGAVRDHKAGTIIGTRTFGKGLVQTVIQLSDGSAVAITTAKYLTPSFQDINPTSTEPGGIAPDIEVDVTEQDFADDNDVQLKKAIDFLKQQIGERPVASVPVVGKKSN
jgi:carboxyl-terminal processing protease